MIRRRRFLQWFFALTVLPWRKLAVASGEAGYVQLRETVEVPLVKVNGAWQPVSFTAWRGLYRFQVEQQGETIRRTGRRQKPEVDACP